MSEESANNKQIYVGFMICPDEYYISYHSDNSNIITDFSEKGYKIYNKLIFDKLPTNITRLAISYYYQSYQETINLEILHDFIRNLAAWANKLNPYHLLMFSTTHGFQSFTIEREFLLSLDYTNVLSIESHRLMEHDKIKDITERIKEIYKIVWL